MRRRRLALVAVFEVLGLTGCTAPPPVVMASTAPAAAAIVDPLTTITDSESPEFVAARLSPVLHRFGEGPTRYSFTASAGKGSVRSYLACAPAGHFRVTIAGRAYWGGCDRQFTSTADLPIATEQPRSEHVTVTVAAGTHFKFLLIPTPEN